MMVLNISKSSDIEESGSIIFFILLAVVLMAALSFTIMNGNRGNNSISNEKLLIYSTEVEQYGSELAQAVKIVLDTGISETAISFAHADAPAEYGDATTIPVTTQIFSISGGQAEYRLPKPDISTASQWEFYGEYDLPQVGSSRADLIAVLPDVTKEFCDVFNKRQGLDIVATYPIDENVGVCIESANADRYSGAFNVTPKVLQEASFSSKPALRGCVQCVDVSGTPYHAYIVIYER